MSAIGNTLENNALAALASRASTQVVGAIRQASAKTGVDFAYLLQQAGAESSFNPAAKARTSSATGLYQFIESTWMDMVKKHGDKYGIDTKASRSDILALRKDPEKASLLAAEFASENKRYLQQHVGGDIGSTDLYFAHFLGAGGAAGFLNALKENPNATAADLFPREARANRGVFYDGKTGQPRSLQAVYDFFDKKFAAGQSNKPAKPAETSLAHKPANTNSLYQQPEQPARQRADLDNASAYFLSLMDPRREAAAILSDSQNSLFSSGFFTPRAALSPAQLLFLSDINL